jgi:hypothetical protein
MLFTKVVACLLLAHASLFVLFFCPCSPCSAACGINLTAASHIFMQQPCLDAPSTQIMCLSAPLRYVC